MLSAAYMGQRTFTIGGSDEPEPGPGQVAVSVAYTGVCGTDLHIYHGDMDARVTVPAVIGHEMSGRIVVLGDGVEGWSVGDPVTVLPVLSCGHCAACLAGHQHVCSNLVFVGIDAPGSLQQTWIVPAQLLVRLPAGLALMPAALVEPTAVAVHDVRRSGLVAGETAVVVGGGPVGTLIACVAGNAGADVLLVEPDAFRRSVAEGLGLRTIDPSTEDVTAVVADATSGAGAQVAFEVSGAAGGVATAVDVLGVRGRLVMVAIHPKPREVNLHRFFWRELTMVGARLYDRSDFEMAVDLVATGVIPVDTLISRVVPLSEVAAAFDALESGSGVMKVLVDCQAGSA
ncbi:alcohol dehydrogenase catalytic domain-containing protein [Acidothermaceae bacterium B102]|nr:alcohol dehydrogenase catalytic domain-containing protein [Acidothermaceae bacterium B102]